VICHFESIQLEVIFWNLLEGLNKVTLLIEIGVIIYFYQP